MDNCIIILMVFIIISSYLFKIKWTDPNTQQLLYVFGGLLIIIIMKQYYLTETFVDNENQTANNNTTLGELSVTPTEDELPQDWSQIQSVTSNNFSGLKKILTYLKGIDEQDLNKEETQNLIKQLSLQFNKFEPAKLDHQLSQITTLLQNLQNVSSLTTTPNTDDTKEDNILENKSIRESQFLQDTEIQNLENEVTELQKIYSNYLEKEAKKNYKKIPVYSSCVMEANGSTSKSETTNFGFETAKQLKRKQQLITGEPEKDPENQSLNKLIKSISEGGISIAMSSK